MKLLLAGIALLFVGGAFAVGLAAAPPPPPSLVVTAGRGAVSSELAHPNPRAQLAIALVAGGLSDPAVARSAGDAEAARPVAYRAPEPDLAFAFRRQLSAVVAQRQGGPYFALLSGEGGSRVLRPCEVFEGKWKLAHLDLAEAVFARGKDRRTVALFDPTPAVAAATPPVAAEAAPAAAADPPAEGVAASSPPEGVSSPPLD